MSVLITGGNGHIGSWISYLLARKGKRVIIYDSNKNYPQYLLQELKEQLIFVHGDILDLPRLVTTFKKYENDIEGIIHTIAIMGESVQINPYQSIKLNIIGLLNILETARIFRIKKVVYTSTGAVYGELPDMAHENQNLKSSDLYGATKIASELLGEQYRKNFGIDFRVGRLYFVYGPGKYPSEFTNPYKITFGLLEGLEGLVAERGGDQKLDFTYVEDAAMGIVLLYEQENLKHQIFNIASGRSEKISGVIKLARKYSHFPSDVKIGKGKLMERCESLDIELAKKELGYSPEYDLEKGIEIYSNWLKENQKRQH